MCPRNPPRNPPPPNRIAPFRVSYDQKPATFRRAEGDVSRLGNRVVRVRTGGGQGVAQSRCCFFKRDVVLPQIRAGFLRIPFQYHVRIIPRCESDSVPGRAQEACPVRCDLPAGPPSGADPRNSCSVHARHRAERVSQPRFHTTIVLVIAVSSSRRRWASLQIPR